MVFGVTAHHIEDFNAIPVGMTRGLRLELESSPKFRGGEDVVQKGGGVSEPEARVLMGPP